MLSIVSLITFVDLEDRGRHLRRRRRLRARCCRSCTSTSAALYIDSFWIGSVLVIVLTGLYTALGGMRAVAYNDAVQVVVLIAGSAALTFYGLYQLGGWGELRAHRAAPTCSTCGSR